MTVDKAAEVAGVILEEKDALDDYHKLDNLEFKRDEINRFLQELQ